MVLIPIRLFILQTVLTSDILKSKKEYLVPEAQGMEKLPFQASYVILRPYDFVNDPPKLVHHLFTTLNNKKGIARLQREDEFFKEAPEDQIRFVAEIEGEIYSTITLIRKRWEKDKFGVYSVVTAEKFRGTGLSQLLFCYACRWAKQHEGRFLLLSTWEDNSQARRYYEKVGFKQYGLLPNGLLNRKGKGFINQIFYYYNLDWMNEKEKFD